MRVIVFSTTGPDMVQNLLLEELAKLGIDFVDVFTDGKSMAAFLDGSVGKEKCLCIVSGYPFDEPDIAGIFARAVDDGMRLLVFDTGIDNKQLAERLKISNIKHKVRIEKMEFTGWDDVKSHLLAVVLKDEVSRLK